MQSIKIKIKLPSFGKENKREIEAIQFSEVQNLIDDIKSKNEISEYYGMLKKSYENFMENYQKVESALEILEDEGEKTFTSAIKKKLRKIEELNKFDISSFQEFYTKTFEVIDIVKISPKVQYEVLKYEKGKETIESINSFLKRLRELKEVLAKRYSEYSVVNHFENVLKKKEEINGLKELIENLEKDIEAKGRKLKDKKKLLDEKNNELEKIKSDLDVSKVEEIQNKINSLDESITEVEPDLKKSLVMARRPISKILHSSTNKKIFDFFREKFLRFPLENINEKFWEMMDILKNNDTELSETELEDLGKFLKFVDKELEKKVLKLKNLEIEKKNLEKRVKKISLKNDKILRDIKKGREKIEEDIRRLKRQLESLEEERNVLEKKVKKGIKILGIMLSKVCKNKIRIKN